MGSWRCTGSRILTCYVSFDGDVCSIVGKETETSHVKIRRQYHVHGTDRDLHRMIAFVVSPRQMPTFSPSQVVCPEDISLDTQQKDYIKDAIGLLL